MHPRTISKAVAALRTALDQDDRAETGVGTLIVFIAMILVAAVAAGVLISTASDLQEQAKATGNSATNQVSTSLQSVGVYGERSGTGTLSAYVDNVTMTIQLASGSPAIDLNQLRIRYSDGTNAPREMSYTSGSATNATFTASSLRDADSSFSSSNPVVNANDLVKVTIGSVWLNPRASVTISLLPEEGIPTPVEFTTPTTYGTAKYISLA